MFPTSGQANPTLLITALSARLAAHVARLVRDTPADARPREATAATVRPFFTGEPHAAALNLTE